MRTIDRLTRHYSSIPRRSIGVPELTGSDEETFRLYWLPWTIEEKLELNKAIEAYNKHPDWFSPDIPRIPKINEGITLPSDPGAYGPRQYAKGGIVPGPVGRPQLAVVHGGEEVIPASRRGSGGGVNYYLNFTFDHISVAEARRQIGQVVRDIIADGGLGDVGLARS